MDENEVVWSGEMNRREDYFQGVILASDKVITIVRPSDRPGARGESLERKSKAYVKEPLSVEKYLKRGLRRDDLAWDYRRNFISIVEPDSSREVNEDPARASLAAYFASKIR